MNRASLLIAAFAVASCQADTSSTPVPPTEDETDDEDPIPPPDADGGEDGDAPKYPAIPDDTYEPVKKTLERYSRNKGIPPTTQYMPEWIAVDPYWGSKLWEIHGVFHPTFFMYGVVRPEREGWYATHGKVFVEDVCEGTNQWVDVKLSSRSNSVITWSPNMEAMECLLSVDGREKVRAHIVLTFNETKGDSSHGFAYGGWIVYDPRSGEVLDSSPGLRSPFSPNPNPPGWAE